MKKLPATKLRKTRVAQKAEIAVELIKQLDGISIQDAKNALIRATELLETTQLVSAKTL